MCVYVCVRVFVCIRIHMHTYICTITAAVLLRGSGERVECRVRECVSGMLGGSVGLYYVIRI